MNEKNIADLNKTCTEKTYYSDVSLKELIGKPEIQAVLAKYVDVPDRVVIKKVRSPFKNKETNITTQKIESVSGTSVMDIVAVSFTLVGTELDAVNSINKVYRLTDYTFALEANMSGGRFNGYSAKGLKLLVTKIEELEGNRNEKSEA